MIFVPLSNGVFRVDAPEYVVGKDCTIGYIRQERFAPILCVSLSEADLKNIFLKLREFNKFGVNIPVCENCGGTPAFPKNDPNSPGCECVWGNHGLLDEN